MHRVLVLGAGFGGLELATRLAELAPGELDVTLVDQKDHFYVGFTKIDVLFGRTSAAAVKHGYRDLAAKTVHFRQEHVRSIEAAERRVVTSAGTYDADTLVVALGADVEPSLTPGLLEDGHEFYTLEGAERAAAALAKITRGRVLVSILGVPHKCPPAPYEVVLRLHDHFAARGLRSEVELHVATPAPVPLGVSKDGSAKLLQLMSERGIVFSPGTLVTSLDPARHEAVTKDGRRLPYDLFLGVPIHRVPRAVVDAGLAPEGGWVAVDPHTLETRFPGVYAIGDVTTIPVGEGAVPKAGAFADRAARAVADDIVARVRGAGARGRFDAAGTCYLELGEGQVAMIDANFLGGPAPKVDFLGPTPDLLPNKTAFASDRLARWFTR